MPHDAVHRRDFLRTLGLGAASLAVAGPTACGQSEGGEGEGDGSRPPNIVFIMADDLGYGEVGAYGQTKIRTPSLDRMAAEGMRFTQHYSGSPVCAPSRCVLLTGLHTGHAYIRGNDEMADRGDVWRDLSLEGQRPLSPGTTTMGTLLQEAGYVTGAMGKWGLGGPGSSGAPNRQGFDRWYGYLGQRLAHNYYPVHLWSDSTKHVLEENAYFHPHQGLPEEADPLDPAAYANYSGGQYSHDLIAEEALSFVRGHADQPFFLYLPFTIPHLALQVPEDALAEYEGEFEETPYTARNGSYLPHRAPRAAYAAMITRMDRDIGRVMDLIGELGLDENTLFIFTSDNGPSWVGGVDFEYFGSQGGLRGRKAQLWEGGIRVPTLARWTGKIDAGTVTDLPSAFWDWLPTLMDVAGARTPQGLDGVSILPTLLGRPGEQEGHEYLYWEFVGGQAVRMGDWKGLRLSQDEPLQLFHLASDPAESTDVASENPEVVARIETILTEARTESDLFPLRRG